jgi:hypothetical protein
MQLDLLFLNILTENLENDNLKYLELINHFFDELSKIENHGQRCQFMKIQIV